MEPQERFGGLPPAGRPSSSSDTKLTKPPKSSTFSVRRVVFPPEIAAERPFQTTMPTGGNQAVIYSNDSRWMAKKYNPFESSMRVATRFYTTSKKGLSPTPQGQPTLTIMQCIRYLRKQLNETICNRIRDFFIIVQIKLTQIKLHN